MKKKSDKQKVFVVGPTASGKTNYAIELAKELNGELINIDSMQIYKLMNIGTNKGLLNPNSNSINIKDLNKNIIKVEEFDVESSGVNGYIFDIIYPDQEFNVADYLFLSNKIAEVIIKKGKTPIYVGGTGFYVDAVMNNSQFPNVQPDHELRKSLEKYSLDQLYDEIYKRNPSEALKLNLSDRSNKRKLIRRIELLSSGLETEVKSIATDYTMYYPKFNRDDLYIRINNRVDEMIEQGFIREVENLIELGFGETKPMEGMGYKEIKQFLKGEYSKEEAILKMKQAHRNYASRQITWFEGKARGYKLSLCDV